MPHRHHKPGARIFDRSTSFCSRRAMRDACASHRDATTAKLLRKKKNESWAMRLGVVIDGQRPPLHGKQVRLSELEETCYAKSSSLVSGARAFCSLPLAFCRRLFRCDSPKAAEIFETAWFTEKTEAVLQNAGQDGHHARAPP